MAQVKAIEPKLEGNIEGKNPNEMVREVSSSDPSLDG